MAKHRFICRCRNPVPRLIVDKRWTEAEKLVLVFCFIQIMLCMGGSVRDWTLLQQYYNHSVGILSENRFPCLCGRYRERTSFALKRYIRTLRNRHRNFDEMYREARRLSLPSFKEYRMEMDLFAKLLEDEL